MKGGFLLGCTVGALGAIAALVLYSPIDASATSGIVSWVQLNLGHSIWLFGIVSICFALQLTRLRDILHSQAPVLHEVSRLDQILDVWIQVFIGIGVVWTAVGMRSALQTALGEPTTTLADGADDVLRKLVDGGILLALSTTIAGAVGGYAMRLVKTMFVGAALQSFYLAQEHKEVNALLSTAQRIEAFLNTPINDSAVVTNDGNIGAGVYSGANTSNGAALSQLPLDRPLSGAKQDVSA